MAWELRVQNGFVVAVNVVGRSVRGAPMRVTAFNSNLAPAALERTISGWVGGAAAETPALASLLRAGYIHQFVTSHLSAVPAVAAPSSPIRPASVVVVAPAPAPPSPAQTPPREVVAPAPSRPTGTQPMVPASPQPRVESPPRERSIPARVPPTTPPPRVTLPPSQPTSQPAARRAITLNLRSLQNSIATASGGTGRTAPATRASAATDAITSLFNGRASITSLLAANRPEITFALFNQLYRLDGFRLFMDQTQGVELVVLALDSNNASDALSRRVLSTGGHNIDTVALGAAQLVRGYLVAELARPRNAELNAELSTLVRSTNGELTADDVVAAALYLRRNSVGMIRVPLTRWSAPARTPSSVLVPTGPQPIHPSLAFLSELRAYVHSQREPMLTPGLIQSISDIARRLNITQSQADTIRRAYDHGRDSILESLFRMSEEARNSAVSESIRTLRQELARTEFSETQAGVDAWRRGGSVRGRESLRLQFEIDYLARRFNILFEPSQIQDDLLALDRMRIAVSGIPAVRTTPSPVTPVTPTPAVAQGSAGSVPVQRSILSPHIGVIGDSITQGGIYTRRLMAVLQTVFPDVRVNSLGLDNDTLIRIHNRFRHDVLDRNPPFNTVIIQGGVNDLTNSAINVATSAQHLRNMVQEARSQNLRVILLTIAPWAGARHSNPDRQAHTEELNTIIRGLAAGRGVSVVDLSSLGTGSPPALRREFDSGDHLHLNTAGQREIARLIAMQAYGFREENGELVRGNVDPATLVPARIVRPASEPGTPQTVPSPGSRVPSPAPTPAPVDLIDAYANQYLRQFDSVTLANSVVQGTPNVVVRPMQQASLPAGQTFDEILRTRHVESVPFDALLTLFQRGSGAEQPYFRAHRDDASTLAGDFFAFLSRSRNQGLQTLSQALRRGRAVEAADLAQAVEQYIISKINDPNAPRDGARPPRTDFDILRTLVPSAFPVREDIAHASGILPGTGVNALTIAALSLISWRFANPNANVGEWARPLGFIPVERPRQTINNPATPTIPLGNIYGSQGGGGEAEPPRLTGWR